MAEDREKELDQNTLLAFTTSDFFQLLSLSLQWPSEELAAALVDGSYRIDAMNILAELSCSQGVLALVQAAFNELEENVSDAAALLKELRREYTRLFNHPEQPVLPIYESVFLERQKGTAATRELYLNPVAAGVERCYRAAGLINKSREPADHMAAELEFMMYLYRNKGKALQEQNSEQAAEVDEQIREFVRQHLGQWYTAFFAGLEAGTQVQFYRVVGMVANSGFKQALSC